MDSKVSYPIQEVPMTGSTNLTPHFTCGISRSDPLELPAATNAALESLRIIEAPEALREAHCPWHLVSFAAHVQRIVDAPVEVRHIDGRRYVHILGQCVLFTDEAGLLRLQVWWRREEQDPFELHATEPDLTPFLDFPRTDLWTQKMQEALQREALHRGASLGWADWAWSWIHLKVVSRVDIRRLRAQIRGALQLDRETLRLLRLRAASRARSGWLIADYNRERGWRDTMLRLEREAPALLPLCWGLRDREDFDRSLDPKKALRRITRTLGITPETWRVLAGSGRRGLATYRAVSREFFVGTEEARVLEYLALFRLMRPARLPSLEFCRQVLGMTGTRWDAPEWGYAAALGRREVPLRHIVRLAERRATQGEPPLPAGELHAVLAWIAEVCVTRLSPPERRGGWAWLSRKAEEHRRSQQLRHRQGALVVWEPLITGFRSGQFHVLPIVSTEEVWAEAIAMRHCADSHAERCAAREVAMFSVRRHCGKRVATVAFAASAGGWWRFGCSGKANSEPSREVFLLAQEIASRLQAVPTGVSSTPAGYRPESLLDDPAAELGDHVPQPRFDWSLGSLRAALGLLRVAARPERKQSDDHDHDQGKEAA
jgi:hypothetical protein